MSPRSGWLLVNEIVPRLRSAVPLVARCVGAEARRRHMNTSTLLYHKRRLGDAVLEHFGKDIIPQLHNTHADSGLSLA
jgi:hypothetical protein